MNRPAGDWSPAGKARGWKAYVQDMEGVMDYGFAILFILVISVYFLPSLWAVLGKHRHEIAIVLINAAFGWTLFGWLIALAWAIKGPWPSESKSNIFRVVTEIVSRETEEN